MTKEKEKLDTSGIIFKAFTIYMIVMAISVVVVFQIIYLNMVQGEKYSGRDENYFREITLPARRGDICALDGTPLASSVPWYEVYIDMRVDSVRKVFAVKSKANQAKIDSLAAGLNRIFGSKSKAEYRKILVRQYRKKGQISFGNNWIDFRKLRELEGLPILRAGLSRDGFQYYSNRGGLSFIQHNQRVYPYKNLANRTIGKIESLEEKGKSGLEAACDRDLMGRPGKVLAQKIIGNYWMPINNGDKVEPVDGLDVVSTIDVSMQDIVQSALMAQMTRHRAHHGTALLMEVKTGEIRAIANLTDTNGRYVEDYNYAIGAMGCTEPGSTFKLPSLMVALEDGVVQLDDNVETGNGVYAYHDRVMKDSHEGGYGTITVREAFEKSSNVGISRIIFENYGKDRESQTRFVDRLFAMNLGTKIDLDLKGLGVPLLKTPADKKNWYGTTLPWMSIGYELKLTPLHLLTFYNAVANDGKMVKPLFIRELRRNGFLEKSFQPEVLKASICSKETLAKARELLEGVVERGTATNLKKSTVRIAGKTGTAQIASGTSGYEKKYQASFAGYFPAEKPAFSIIVVITQPSMGEYYGSTIAGQVVMEIAQKVNALQEDQFRVPRDTGNRVQAFPAFHAGKVAPLAKVAGVLGLTLPAELAQWDMVSLVGRDSTSRISKWISKPGLVPDVRGMGARDALGILENRGLRVSPEGKGKVTSQTPPAGAPFKKGDKVKIILK